jgi:glycosyltransferase involved in cell wall biosynthesis
MHQAAAQVVVAIPAKNEAERIGACLAALAAQRAAPPFLTVLLANNCTDATAAIGQAWRDRLPGLHVVPLTLPPPQSHAGGARHTAMDHAAALATPDAVLLTTDADSRPPPNWVAANLAAIARGADAVAGRAIIDPLEALRIPRHLHELDALECTYAALLDELTALISPDPHDPWPRHSEHSGASIAVRLAAYHAAGGIPCQPTGEDRAFFAALRRTGARIRHAPDVAVIVSGRLHGRATGGMADTIRARIAHPPDWLDDRLEPVFDHLSRLSGSPPPQRRSVAFAEVAAQIAQAQAVLTNLRTQRLLPEATD